MKRLIYILCFLPLVGWGQVVVDSYDFTNQDTYFAAYNGAQVYRGMSFTCTTSTVLDSIQVTMCKTGTPTGNAYALIYAHTGTYGTSSEPTGSALATSDAFDISQLQDVSLGYEVFGMTFSGANKITLASSTYYVLVIKNDNGNSSNYIRIGTDNSSPTASGNRVSSPDGSTWTPATTYDMCFYVYGHYVKNIFLWHNF